MMENRGEGTRPNPKIKIKIRAPAIRSDRAVPEIVPRACLGGIDFIYKTCNFVYKREMEMRTLVDIDENVLKEAMEVSQTTTKKETITLALEELIKSRLRQRLKSTAGSGIIGTGLSDLKRLRQRREKTDKVLRAVAKR